MCATHTHTHKTGLSVHHEADDARLRFEAVGPRGSRKYRQEQGKQQARKEEQGSGQEIREEEGQIRGEQDAGKSMQHFVCVRVCAVRLFFL